MYQPVSVSVSESISLKNVFVELARQAGVDLQLDHTIDAKIIFTAQNRPFIEVIKSMCEKYEVKYKITDITDDHICSSSAFEEFLNKYSDKKKDIENYILYNTSVDDILDKINKFGIDSITEIDKKILG